MQLNLSSRTDDFSLSENVISPLIEMGAYEALWDEHSMTFKKLADLFRENPNALPSDFVSKESIQKYIQETRDMWKKKNLDSVGVRVFGAAEYPYGLRDARHPVELIYYRGWWDLVNSKSVAVVGSRSASEDGQRRARKIGYLLAKAGITVVSGLAKGIDHAALSGAIEAEGNVIGVIGTPLTESYPVESRQLQEKIANDYLLVSQVPFCRYSKQGPNINRMFFPERNKVMSALTMATDNPNINWPEKYEKKGAIRVTKIEDILDQLND